jgi:glycine cleavage system regulatory protein
MQRLLVMTIIGPDRPGLVRSVAGLVGKYGGNWLESRMSRLGGQFAGILRVEVPEAEEQSLIGALQALATEGLRVVAHPDFASPGPAPRRLKVLELVGQDRPGIVSQITGALAKQGVNVEELNTECASAAMSGETLFKARALLSMPDSCDTAALRQELEKIAADLIVEISLTEPVMSEAGR